MTDGEKEMLQFCLTRVTECSDFEAKFIRDRSRKPQYALSEKQAAWLERIYRKLKEGAPCGKGGEKPRAARATAGGSPYEFQCPHCRRPVSVAAIENYATETVPADTNQGGVDDGCPF